MGQDVPVSIDISLVFKTIGLFSSIESSHRETHLCLKEFEIVTSYFRGADPLVVSSGLANFYRKMGWKPGGGHLRNDSPPKRKVQFEGFSL